MAEKSRRPKLFIGSSVEHLDVADALQESLSHDADVTVWDQDVFQLGKSTLDGLLNQLSKVDFAVFVVAPDDEINIRGARLTSARDNVIFELGLFMGRLGSDHAFFLIPQNSKKMRLPSDLFGITALTYDDVRAATEPAAALGVAATKIRRRLKAWRPLQPSGRTPGRSKIRDLVNDAIQMICRAASLPQSPEKSGIRVFIFQHVTGQLVCKHFYSANIQREEVDRTRFDVNSRTAKHVVVVDAFLKKESVRRNLESPTEGTAGVHGNVSPQIKTVVAAPIFVDNNAWGTVDFDATTPLGGKLLNSDVADAAIYLIAKHLGRIVDFDGDGEGDAE